MTEYQNHRKSSRSDQYQHLYNEVTIDIDDKFWSMYVDTTTHHSQEYIEANQAAMDIMIKELMPISLTEKQLKVCMTLLENPDITQADIAKDLDVKQTSINKCLHGNPMPGGGVYGGISKKLQRTCLSSEDFRKAIIRLHEIREKALGL